MSIESDIQTIGTAMDEMEKIARRAVLQRNKALDALREIARSPAMTDMDTIPVQTFRSIRMIACSAIAEIEGEM